MKIQVGCKHFPSYVRDVYGTLKLENAIVPVHWPQPDVVLVEELDEEDKL